MIELAEAELWAFDTLNTSVLNVQRDLQKAIAARDAYLKLLESKYDAVFNPDSGALEPKEKTK